MQKSTKKIAFILAWILVIPVFSASQLQYWGISASVATATEVDPAVQAVADAAAAKAEADRKEAEKKANKIQDDIEKAQKQKAALEQNLGQIKSAVATTQSKINQSKTVISDTVQAITSKQQEIINLNNKLDLQRELLKSFLQEIYYTQNKSQASIALSDGSFLDIFGNADHLQTMDDKIIELMSDVRDTQAQIEADKVGLNETKQQHEKTLIQTASVKNNLIADQQDVQQDIESKEQIISKLRQQLAELQSDLSTVTGNSYSTDDIWKAVKFASERTGVPKGFLMGMLKMETNLGANVGGCTYGQVESGAQASYKKGKLGKTAWATFQRRRDIFTSICKSLGIDYKKQKVSCNPSGYTGTGGAMGVAQFMPDTWMGYTSQVTGITGNSPASPWSLGDGVTAMALKLKRTPGVTSGSKSAFKSAACSYLGTCYAPYINGIIYWADHYKELLD